MQELYYRDSNIINHIMKLQKKIIEKMFREEITVPKNKFNFRPGRPKIKPIFCMLQLIRKI